VDSGEVTTLRIIHVIRQHDPEESSLGRLWICNKSVGWSKNRWGNSKMPTAQSKLFIIFVFCMLSIVSGTLLAQEKPNRKSSSIEFGAAKLYLGMSIDEVVSLLKRDGLELRFIDKLSDDIMRCHIAGPGCKSLGSVDFTAGKAVMISKEWDISNQPPQTLFYLLQQFTREGRTSCTIRTQSRDDATALRQHAYVTCGEKWIHIYFFRPRDESIVVAGVSEELGR
jgi:hypothetical protein